MELNGNAGKFGKFYSDVMIISAREMNTFDLKSQQAIHNNAYMNTMWLFECYNTYFIQSNLLWYTIFKIFYLGVFFWGGGGGGVGWLSRGSFHSHATWCNHLVYCCTLRTAIKCRGASYLLAL